MTALLDIRDLSVDFDTDEGRMAAVRGLDLTVERGSCVGIVGESGCGKSVSMLAVMGLLPPTASVSGSIEFDGVAIDRTDPSQHSRDIVMVFQDSMSSLNPLMRVGTQIAEVLHYRCGTPWRTARREVGAHLERVGINAPEAVARQYPYELSGGMRQRVMLASALAAEPTLLIADEATTGLDVTVQAQIIDLLHDLRRDLGLSVIFISHDLGVVAELCDVVAVVYGGRVLERGPTRDVIDVPQHPYSRGLVDSYPRMGAAAGRRLRTIPGAPPVMGQLDSGCAFRDRCPHADGMCEMQPPVSQIADSWHVECHHVGAGS